MTSDKLEKGKAYILTYTRPMYIPSEKKYLPDNFRFIEPHIVPVFFGGRCKESRYCAVCGRRGVNSRVFVRKDDFKEIYVSDHCYKHDSTQIWAEDTPESHIEEWYKREDLERAARAGDPIAGLAKAFEEMEAQEDYFL